MTKIKDLRSMSKEDLNSKLVELKKEMIKNNAQIATGTTPKNPGQIREIKKTIARILTIVGTQEVKVSKAKEDKKKIKSSKISEKAKEKEQVSKAPAKKETEEKING